LPFLTTAAKRPGSYENSLGHIFFSNSFHVQAWIILQLFNYIFETFFRVIRHCYNVFCNPAHGTERDRPKIMYGGFFQTNIKKDEP